MSLEQELWNRTPKEVWFRVGHFLSHKEFGRLALSSRTLFFNEHLRKKYEARKNIQVPLDLRRRYHEELKRTANGNPEYTTALFLYDLLEKNGYEVSPEIQMFFLKVLNHINIKNLESSWGYISPEFMAEGEEVPEDKWPAPVARSLNELNGELLGHIHKRFLLDSMNVDLLSEYPAQEDVLQGDKKQVHLKEGLKKRYAKCGIPFAALAFALFGAPLFGAHLGSWPSLVCISGLVISGAMPLATTIWYFETQYGCMGSCLEKSGRSSEKNLTSDDVDAQREQQPLLEEEAEDPQINPAIGYQSQGMFSVVINGEDLTHDDLSNVSSSSEVRRLGG